MRNLSGLKARRLAMGYSQYEVEKLTGIHQTRLSLVENGYREPSNEEKKILAKTLRCNVGELFPEPPKTA